MDADAITIDYSVSVTGAFGESFAKPIDVSNVPAVRDAIANAVRDAVTAAVRDAIAAATDSSESTG